MGLDDETDAESYDGYYVDVEEEVPETSNSSNNEVTAEQYLEQLHKGITAPRETDELLAMSFSIWRDDFGQKFDDAEIPVSKRSDALVLQDLQIEGATYQVVLDTGAQISLIPRRVVMQVEARRGKEYLAERITPSNMKLRGITQQSVPTSHEVALIVNSGNTLAKVQFLIDERVERDGARPLPIILGRNGLAALGYSLISPDGEMLMTPAFHKTNLTVSRNGETIYDGRPCCSPLGIAAFEESERRRKQDPEIPDEPIPVTLEKFEDPEALQREVAKLKDAARAQIKADPVFKQRKSRSQSPVRPKDRWKLRG
jgi:hypothetical protein